MKSENYIFDDFFVIIQYIFDNLNAFVFEEKFEYVNDQTNFMDTG